MTKPWQTNEDAVAQSGRFAVPERLRSMHGRGIVVADVQRKAEMVQLNEKLRAEAERSQKREQLMAEDDAAFDALPRAGGAAAAVGGEGSSAKPALV